MERNKSMGVVIGLAAVVLVGGGILFAMNSGDDKKESTTQPQQTTQTQTPPATQPKKVGNIVAVAAETPSLSTLVTAVKAADLVTTLQAAGPYTVFAPTNAAFEALPAGTLDTLLKAENIGQLKSVLTYHVVSGKVMAADLKDGQEVTTVQGARLTVSISGGKVYLTDAKGNKVTVEAADVSAENGVVHVISGVLLPS